MRKLTILHTIETAGPGGAETVLLNLATGLDPARFRSLAVVCGEDWLTRQLRAHSVETILVKWNKWYDLRLPRAMARLVREQNVDLIHSHLPDQNFYSCLAGRMTGRPVVATYHGAVELAHLREPRQALKFWLVKRSAARVVTVCDHVRGLLVEAGFDSRRLERIYNGIAPERYAAARNGHLRASLGLRNGAPLVGMVANVRQSKGYEFYIRAARQVADAVPEARFLAIGDLHPELSRPLVELVRELGLEDRFHFLGFREDVPALLGELDVFVLASTSEGFPLVTLEAMAAGKPMVVTRCGGPPEAVEDARTGFLVPPGDADALAEKITAVLADPARAAAMGAAGRERVQREFTLEKMVREYEQLYERVVDGR